MPPRTYQSTVELGALIRSRREELELSIEQAAAAARLGSETWRRYEAGGAIRIDKVRAVCKALRWRALPVVGQAGDRRTEDLAKWWESARHSEAYSEWIAREVGDACARVFAVGCDVAPDLMREDLEGLASLPRGTHIGELPFSSLENDLPHRWMMRYDYEFVYRFLSTIQNLARRAVHQDFEKDPYLTQCFADALAVHVVMQTGFSAFDDLHGVSESQVVNWEDELSGDFDVELNWTLTEEFHPGPHDPSHFDHWFDKVFTGREPTVGQRVDE
jgi:hypothetical protein